MDPNARLSSLIKFTDQFSPDVLEQASFQADLARLAPHLLSEKNEISVSNRFSSDQSDWRKKPLANISQINKLVDRTKVPPEPTHRIFRREVPLTQSLINGSQPNWAAGITPSETVGPYPGRDGRLFWFDLFPIIKLVPLYLAGQNNPALLFYIKETKVKTKGKKLRTDLTPSNLAIKRFRGSKYTLEESSIWIRADLLAQGAPNDRYAGFDIGSGEISVSKKPKLIQGKLTIPANASCKVQLDFTKKRRKRLKANPLAGQDAKDAKITLPKLLEFQFSQQQIQILKAGNARWELYGQKLSFKWDQQSSAAYDPSSDLIFIPYRANRNTFNATESNSPFASLSGEAEIQQAAWIVPLSAVDINQPVQAEGQGGIAIQTEEGLEMSWRGLREGPVQLSQPWIGLFPNLLTILANAGNLYANQRFLLWKENEEDHRSTVELQYTDSFPLIYAAHADGTEALMVTAHAEANLDRPVDVACRALEIRSKNSLLVLSYTDSQQLVYLYDDNILTDNLDASQPLDEQFPDPISLAIRNALLTTTPVNGFLLFAEMLDEERVLRGNVLLSLGLYGFLPTLPDPYAANVGVFRKLLAAAIRSRQVSSLLVGHIAWEKLIDDLDTVHTNFQFAALPNRQNTLLSEEASFNRLDSNNNEFRISSDFARVTAASSTAVAAARIDWEAEWDRLFGRFYQEQFALLDVSTNADWMGVSMAYFNRERVTDNDYVFYRIYGTQQTDEQTQQLFPIQVEGLDLTAQGRYVRAFTVPQISWEPFFNLPGPQPPQSGDPPLGFSIFPNDGGPTRIFNDNTETVPIAPLPKVEELLHYFNDTSAGFTGALFTLPFGLKAFAEINKNHDIHPDAKFRPNQFLFRNGELKGGLQLQVDAPIRSGESPMFIGGTLQLNNLKDPNNQPASTLGDSVSTIFNGEFFVTTGGYGDRGVPLERIDFSGYGANIFSRWENSKAAFAQTSQARFDVFRGRTAHEVIQVKSVVYPWGIRVVRTIIIFRVSSGYVYRYDTGWQAETPGVYDFSYYVKNFQNPIPNPYEFHPGLVKGVYNVQNILETEDIPVFERTWNKNIGDTYVDDAGNLQTIDNATPAQFKSVSVKLKPVYFDADADIDFVKSGAVNGKVPSKKMLGYVQLAPTGEPVPDFFFRDLLREQFGSLGGPVDCTVDIGSTGQQMRLTRIDVSESISADGAKPLFVSTARGSVILPKDGSWSTVQYQHGTQEVSPLPDNATVPLIRLGKLGTNPPDTHEFRLENPMELVRNANNNSIFYGLLQTTGTQKALFRKPRFQMLVDELQSETPDIADAYRMLNSSGIFPNLKDSIPLDLGDFKTRIIDEGFKLLDQANPDAILEKALPDGPWYIIDEEFIKLYIEYDKKDKDGNKTSDGSINFGIDSAAQDLGKKWLTKLNDIGMVVDLGPFPRLLMIKGKFDTEKGAIPAFQGPELEFSDALQPVIDILQILLMLNGGDYADALSKGLEIAMSNSADSWNYAFHARKEIPLVKFPPGPAYEAPTNPLKLECGLSVGVYFNEVFSLTDSPDQLVPSAGAYLGFYGRLAVMCVSVGVGTIYATGSVDLRIGADIKTGPSLFMGFGFGAEVSVGLPVIGTVSVLYMVGVEIYMDSTKIVSAAFLLFRGRAEILGGIVTVTIQIEAKGIVERQLGPGTTNMIAQVTFGLDISIFLVINLSFSKSWEVSKQLA